jgi:hypothetical protein
LEPVAQVALLVQTVKQVEPVEVQLLGYYLQQAGLLVLELVE